MKLMGALGLFFGLTNIIIVSLVSFLVCAVLSIFLLATRIKKTRNIIMGLISLVIYEVK